MREAVHADCQPGNETSGRATEEAQAAFEHMHAESADMDTRGSYDLVVHVRVHCCTIFPFACHSP
jgi:hypothetical protein